MNSCNFESAYYFKVLLGFTYYRLHDSRWWISKFYFQISRLLFCKVPWWVCAAADSRPDWCPHPEWRTSWSTHWTLPWGGANPPKGMFAVTSTWQRHRWFCRSNLDETLSLPRGRKNCVRPSERLRYYQGKSSWECCWKREASRKSVCGKSKFWRDALGWTSSLGGFCW